MNQSLPNTIVDNVTQFEVKYKEIVENIVQNRKQSQTTQDEMANWLKISRSTLTDFESVKRMDFSLLVKYGYHMGIDVKLNFEIN